MLTVDNLIESVARISVHMNTRNKNQAEITESALRFQVALESMTDTQINILNDILKDY